MTAGVGVAEGAAALPVVVGGVVVFEGMGCG